MPNVSFSSLLIVTVVAFTVPLLLGLTHARRLPVVVLEIVAGIALGLSGLSWVKIDLPSTHLLPVLIFPLVALTVLRHREQPSVPALVKELITVDKNVV